MIKFLKKQYNKQEITPQAWQENANLISESGKKHGNILQKSQKHKMRQERIIVHTIGPKNKAASATREVIMTSGWYFSRHSTMGAAPRYVLLPFIEQKFKNK